MAIKPLFLDKNYRIEKITLIDKVYIILDDVKIAEIMNTFFSNVVENLNIQGYNVNYSRHKEPDLISLTNTSRNKNITSRNMQDLY